MVWSPSFWKGKSLVGKLIPGCLQASANMIVGHLAGQGCLRRTNSAAGAPANGCLPQVHGYARGNCLPYRDHLNSSCLTLLCIYHTLSHLEIPEMAQRGARLWQNSLHEMTGQTDSEQRARIWSLSHKRAFFCTAQVLKNDVCRGEPLPLHMHDEP